MSQSLLVDLLVYIPLESDPATTPKAAAAVLVVIHTLVVAFMTWGQIQRKKVS